jgi:sortase A
MQKNRLSLLKRIIRLPSLGLLILGLICITWALTNIIQQSTAINDSMHSISSDESANLMTRFPQMSTDNQSALIQKQLLSITADRIIEPIRYAEGDAIGSLTIPVLDLKLPILEGTEESTLKKGVGHFTQSVLPGTEDNCVLSGHRDTVFSKLGKLAIGDLLIINSTAGTFTYKVSNLRIVENDDRTVIIPTDHGVLTLTTCYPFQFIGSATQRYIVSADLVIEK